MSKRKGKKMNKLMKRKAREKDISVMRGRVRLFRGQINMTPTFLMEWVESMNALCIGAHPTKDLLAIHITHINLRCFLQTMHQCTIMFIHLCQIPTIYRTFHPRPWTLRIISTAFKTRTQVMFFQVKWEEMFKQNFQVRLLKRRERRGQENRHRW